MSEVLLLLLLLAAAAAAAKKAPPEEEKVPVAPRAELPSEEAPPPTVVEKPKLGEEPVVPTPELIPTITLPTGEQYEVGRLDPKAVQVDEGLFDCLADKGVLTWHERVAMYSNEHIGKIPYYMKYYYYKGRSMAHVQGYLTGEPRFRMAKDGAKVAKYCDELRAEAIKTTCVAAKRKPRLYETPEGKEQVKKMVKDYTARLTSKARTRFYTTYSRYWWA